MTCSPLLLYVAYLPTYSDHPFLFRGRSVLDFGCGCGSAGIAALLSGADRVLMNDIDEAALIAAKLNAQLNLDRQQMERLSFSSRNFLAKPDMKRQEIEEETSTQLQPSFNPQLLKEWDLTRQFTADVDLSFDIVLVGDMFYDHTFGDMVFNFIERLREISCGRPLPEWPEILEKSSISSSTTSSSSALSSSSVPLVLVGDPGRWFLDETMQKDNQDRFHLLAEYDLNQTTLLENRGFSRGYVWNFR